MMKWKHRKKVQQGRVCIGRLQRCSETQLLSALVPIHLPVCWHNVLSPPRSVKWTAAIYTANSAQLYSEISGVLRRPTIHHHDRCTHTRLCGLFFPTSLVKISVPCNAEAQTCSSMAVRMKTWLECHAQNPALNRIEHQLFSFLPSHQCKYKLSIKSQWLWLKLINK